MTSTPLQLLKARSWETSKTYKVNDLIEKDGYLIKCLTAHTSGTYATDVKNKYWQLATPSRNYLINSNFDIWQRDTTQTLNGYGSDDRWLNVNIGSTKTHSRQAFTLGQTDVPGEPTYFSRTVVTSVAGASNAVDKTQRIESVKALAGKTISYSFYAKADSSKNIAVDLEQFFGTGGSPSASVSIQPTTFTLTSAWQKFVATVTIPSISGKILGTNNNDFLGFRIWFDAGSDYNSFTNSLGQQSGTFEIAQVMLNEGPAPASFQTAAPNFQAELAMCQRYYEKIGFNLGTVPAQAISGARIGVGHAWSTTAISVVVSFKVQKRNNAYTTTYYSGNAAGVPVNGRFNYLKTGGWVVSTATTEGVKDESIIETSVAGTFTVEQVHLINGALTVDAEI